MSKIIASKSIVAATKINFNTRLNESEVNLIRLMKAQGYHYTDIAAYTGYCYATVRKYAGSSMTQRQITDHINTHLGVRLGIRERNVPAVRFSSNPGFDNIVPFPSSTVNHEAK